MTNPDAPAELMVTAPVKLPEPRLDGSTLTFKVAGAVPVGGFTESQLPLLLVEAVAVNGAEPPAVKETLNGWVCGTVLPAWKLKLSELGEAVKGDAPVTLMFMVTGTLA